MSPKNPNTTEGIPARISIKGFKKSATLRCETSEMYTAQAIPKGTEKITEPAVTRREPRNKGSNPNCWCMDVGTTIFL